MSSILDENRPSTVIGGAFFILSVYFFGTRIIFPFFAEKSVMSEISFVDREKACQKAFLEGGPFCMLTSPSMDFLMFAVEEEFKRGNNLIAIALAGCRVALLHMVIMNNHLHLLVEGSIEDIKLFSLRLESLLRKHQKTRGYVLPSDWCFHELWIKDLPMLRNVIAYISRNPYVASRDATPTGYLWSSGYLLFNPSRRYIEKGVPFHGLRYREKRSICRSHELELPERYMVANEMILPASFVDYQRTEQFFQSANQYFSYLFRRGEADVEISRMTGESILLPNDEVFSIVCGWYQVKTTKMLEQNQRFDAAKRMHRQLGSNPKQIAQILRLPLAQVEQMFPFPSR